MSDHVLEIHPEFYGPLSATEVDALIKRAEETGTDFDVSEIDADDVVWDALRAIFADPTGPEWLIGQRWCGGWGVRVR